jgi:DNA modification methylase
LTVVTEDWTFAHLRRVETLWGPHGYHRYPAKFIPQLVSRLIELYSAPGDLVGDPFLGSATTGIEALRMGRRFWGSDISYGGNLSLMSFHHQRMSVWPSALSCTQRQKLPKS